MDNLDDPVPLYTVDNVGILKDPGSASPQLSGDDFYDRVARAKSLPLPILTAQIVDYVDSNPDHHLILDIVDSLFSSVGASRNELVRDFVSRGLVSPDVKSVSGETPLLAAVRARDLPMIRTLLSLGALVNMYGTSRDALPPAGGGAARYRPEYPERTPLQLAAQTGYLTGVKCLMEDYGADDALIAPDGALALRLAAENGHRDIVNYLPQRRGGALLRWKTAHRREMRVIRRLLKKMGAFVLFFVYTVPEFVLYTAPKETGKAIWKRRRRIATWVTKLPKKVARAARDVSKELLLRVKRAPEYTERLGKVILRFIKAIPVAARIVGNYVYRGAAKIGEAIWEVVKQVVSLLHTAVMAIINFFKTVSLADVRDGVVYVLEALFVSLPKAAVSLIRDFGKMSYDALGALAGGLGKAVWCLGGIFVWLFTYLPVKIWQCLQAMGRLTRRGANECLVLFNPKRM